MHFFLLDFFDKSLKQSESEDVENKMADKLPEGFFDDPKTDAKVIIPS